MTAIPVTLTFDSSFIPSGPPGPPGLQGPPGPKGVGLGIALTGAVGDGVADDTNAVKAAIAAGIAAGQPVYVPPGTYRFTAPIDPVGGTVLGAGRGKTIFRCDVPNVNGFCIRSDKTRLAHLTIDLVHGDSTKTGSGVLLFGADDCLIEDVEVVNANRQGFTADGAQRCIFSNLWAIGCGHRGVNMSKASCGNTFSNIHAADCGFSGFLLGFGSSRNIVTGLHISGFSTSPGLVVDMGSSENQFANVVISDPASATEPFLHVGAASRDNLFSNVILKGVNNRGILLRNEAVDEPGAGENGVVNGPNERNVFSGVKILGAGAGTGIYIDEIAQHGMRGHVFDNLYIAGLTHAIRDVTGTATGCWFTGVIAPGQAVTVPQTSSWKWMI
jgi:hypothetical protein